MVENIKPLVSVGVITYNQKNFLRECLDSILIQDYENIEIIIADDCSTDGTVDVAKEYFLKYPTKIKLALSEKNGGITKNCNNALKYITGDFVALTGGDDLFVQGKITAQVNWFLENPTGTICTTDIEVFQSETNKTISILKSKEFKNSGPGKKIIRQRNQPPSSNFMINKKICSHLHFDERTPIVSDWLFYTDIALQGKIGYINGVYFKYRRHGNSVTSMNTGKSYLDDRLIYTDILLVKYPQYYRSCKIQRANIFFESGKRDFFLQDFKKAKQKSCAGILENPLDIRNWVLLTSCFFGKYAHQIALKYKGA